MIKPYVDLFLKTENNKISTLDAAIDDSQLVVLLGAPGSGKTTLLKHYAQSNNKRVKYFTVHRWLNETIDEFINNGYECALVDGFDELYADYSFTSSKPIHDIANKINEYKKKSLKVILSCRIMDWYGDDNKEALSEYGLSASLLYIQPLTKEQQQTLATQLFDVQEIGKQFWSRYSDFDFMDNPETFTLLTEIYKTSTDDAPKTKMDVYKRYVELSNHFVHSSGHRNANSILSSDEIFRYAGYLAYYCLFVHKFNLSDMNQISTIADDNHKYSLNKLLDVLKTKLFINEQNNKLNNILRVKKFQHRTIAEYLCAHFLYNVVHKEQGVSLKRITNIMQLSNTNHIASEFRGVYAWLCSISQDEACYRIDPYSQLVYGDNSHFSLEEKKRVLRAIYDFSQTEPYFLRMELRQTPLSFYTPKLDDFLIQEYKKGWDHPNHYLILLSDLMRNTEDNPSSELAEFAVEVISHPQLPDHYKTYFVYLLKNRLNSLMELLLKIEANTIEDDNNQLLDRILNQLYPNTIGPGSILEHIKKYKHTEEYYSDFYYLFNTTVAYPELNKLALSVIHEYTENKPFGQFCSQIDNFIAYFWCIAIVNDDAASIFELLIDAITNNWILATQSWRIAFNSDELWYRAHGITQDIPEPQKEKLYSYWLNWVKKHTSEHQFDTQSWHIEDCISLLKPQNRIEIIKSNLSKDNQDDYNLKLLSMIWNELSRNGIAINDVNQTILELAAMYDLKEKCEIYMQLSPEAKALQEKYQIEREAAHKENESIIQKNEEAFASMTEDEKQNAWGYLMGIVPYYLLDRPEDNNKPFDPIRLKLTEKTYRELLRILSSKLLLPNDKRPYSEFASMISLADNSPSASRNVDHLYYAISCLNNEDDYSKLSDRGFMEYLYIINLVLGKAVNIRKNKYCSWYELSADNARDCIIKFIQLILEPVYTIRGQILNYIKSNANGLSALKNLVFFPSLSSHSEYEDYLLKSFVDNFNYQIPYDIIQGILNASRTSIELNDACNALAKFHDLASCFSTNEAVELHKLLSPYNYFKFDNLSDDQKYKLLKILLDVFNKSEMLQYHSGFQLPFDECADFVNRELWYYMKGENWINILNNLLKIHEDDIWTNRLKHKLYELYDSIGLEPSTSSIQIAKNFIFNTGYTNPRDFWIDVCDKLNEIKRIIETSDSNHVNMFYSIDKVDKVRQFIHKDENDCRDALFNIWKAKYGTLVEASSREYVVNNDKRVDFFLSYKEKEDYCIYIECKRDRNSKIDSGIPDQLISLYVKNNQNNYGVYFVFCFEDDPAALKDELITTIPPDYADRIEVICLDLRKIEPVNDTVLNSLLEIIQQNPKITIQELCAKCKKSKKTLNRDIKKLNDMGILTREGSTRSGRWIVHRK